MRVKPVAGRLLRDAMISFDSPTCPSVSRYSELFRKKKKKLRLRSVIGGMEFFFFFETKEETNWKEKLFEHEFIFHERVNVRSLVIVV